ncbi:10554_t:CDS:2, partial [Funneliformis mosseae]
MDLGEEVARRIGRFDLFLFINCYCFLLTPQKAEGEGVALILSFEELMIQILESSNTRLDSTIQGFSSYIPLKERNMTTAIEIFSKNFIQSKSASNVNVDCKFLVCRGAL